MTLQEFNHTSEEKKEELLKMCCGSDAWVHRMKNEFPFEDLPSLLSTSKRIWNSLTEQDWKQAFEHHPRIGDLSSLKRKFASTANWAAGEQSAVANSSEEVLQKFAEANQVYERKFGFIFIVCATGKSASEMLGILESRLENEPMTEVKIAAEEQNRITQLRLEKLLSS